MTNFLPGQRYISVAEPELGLGTVLRVDARTVQILFAKSEVLRHYARSSAPLTRAEFAVGDRISVDGRQLAVDAIVERAGIYFYRCGEREVVEGALDDSQSVSKPNQRLGAGRVDPNRHFNLRLDALERRAAARAGAAWGLMSARIGLIDHQLAVAEAASARAAPRVLLADEVGLGKTIEAGLVLSRLAASGRVTRALVLVPEALVYQWFVELKRRFNHDFAIFDEERIEAIELAGDGRNPFEDEQFVLTDLPFLLGHPQRAEQVLGAHWDLVLVDEAHHLQWSTERASPEYALVEQLAARAPSLVLLTATPEQLGQSGHFARLRLLDPARFHDLDAYRRESAGYLEMSRLAEALESNAALTVEQRRLLQQSLASDGDGSRAGEVDVELANDEERAALVRRLVDRHGTGRVMFRNRRALVGGFPKRIGRLEVLPRAHSEDRVALLIEEFMGDIGEPPFAPPLNYLDDPRLAWLVALLESNPEDKFLLITRCQAKLHALEEALRAKTAVPFARFHEGLGIVQRDRNAAYFAQADGARLLIATEIGSEGRNFQFARHLVLWDLPLDPDLLEQRIGRLDRIGQRHDIQIHAIAHEDSAQHVLMRWFDEGLAAFGGSPEDGRELLKRYGENVVATALATARGQADAGEKLEALIAETQATHAELAAKLAGGRDRLLEMAARSGSRGELVAALTAADEDAAGDHFVLRLIEHFGVDVDEHADGSVKLDPEMLTTEAFPGLADGPRLATFDRATALVREDLLFLRLDHPMVVGALDLMLGSESGNAAFLVDPNLPARTALIETVFVLECVAPAALDVARFLPPTPIRIVIDTRSQRRDDWKPKPVAVSRCDEAAPDPARWRPLANKLVAPLLARAQEAADARALELRMVALANAAQQIQGEVERLTALAAVNPSVRPAEIDALRVRGEALATLLPTALLRLDAIRLVVSADLLGGGGGRG